VHWSAKIGDGLRHANLSFRALRGGAGAQFLCGIASDGTTQCLGMNDMGQLGSTGAPSFSSTPVVTTGD
jgi:hypothetical protein